MERKLDYKQKRIILSWHKLSEENSDYYIKFIADWIAFNAICYAFYYTRALKISAQIDKEKKFEDIISNLATKTELDAKHTSLKKTSAEKSKVKIAFYKEDEHELKLDIYDKKYREDIIFREFYQEYASWYQEKEFILRYFTCFKNSMEKEEYGISYIINMARIDDYKNIIESEFSIEDLKKSGTIILCENNDLKTIVEVLYQIRCNIFHGEKNPGELNDDRIVQAAFPLLNAIVEFLISHLKIEKDKLIYKQISMNNPIKEWLTEETVMNLALVKGMIVLGESDNLKKEWGGAGIIVTSDKEDKRKADIKIVTKHAKHISFLLYQLKDIFKKYIDHSNKREFYGYVVSLIDEEELEKEDDSKKILITMIDKLLGLERES